MLARQQRVLTVARLADCTVNDTLCSLGDLDQRDIQIVDDHLSKPLGLRDCKVIAE